MFFATRDNKEVEEFSLTFFMMTKNLKDSFIEDIEEFRKVSRDTMEGQFEHDLYKKSFSNQIESDELDTLQQRIEWWMTVVDRGGPMPNGVFDWSFGEFFGLYHIRIDPEMQELVKLLRNRQIFRKKIRKEAKCK